MKRFLLPILGLFVAISLIAATTNFTSLMTEEVRSTEFQLGAGVSVDSLGRTVTYVRNKSGATLATGRVVAWDTLTVQVNEIKVLPKVAWADTGSVIAAEGTTIGR